MQKCQYYPRARILSVSQNNGYGDRFSIITKVGKFLSEYLYENRVRLHVYRWFKFSYKKQSNLFEHEACEIVLKDT